MKKAIVIGASSGIGKELAKILAKEYDAIGLAARRGELLEELSEQLDTQTFTVQMDVAKTEEAMQQLDDLIVRMGGVDLVVVCAGTGYSNPELRWDYERETIDVNVKGCTGVINTAVRHFIQQGHGHLVVLSSVAALRGHSDCPAYNASKAYLSNYLEGLRMKMGRMSGQFTITDIQPGFVDTRMAQGEGLFWVAPAQKAARQIDSIIKRRKPRGYVTKRWGVMALCLKIMPHRLYACIAK